jgi:hypothetical protein
MCNPYPTYRDEHGVVWAWDGAGAYKIWEEDLWPGSTLEKKSTGSLTKGALEELWPGECFEEDSETLSDD